MMNMNIYVYLYIYMSPSGLDDLDAWRLRFCLLLKLHFPSLKIGDMTSTLPWDFLGCLKPPVEMVAKSPSSWIVSYWLAYLLSIYCLENTWKTDSQKFLLHNVSVSQVHHVIRWMYFLIIKNKRWIVAIRYHTMGLWPK